LLRGAVVRPGRWFRFVFMFFVFVFFNILFDGVI
jgi:hypothetical protein